MRASELQRLVN
jgi:type II secretory pathway pseudopilin PulG